ncbi:hypothetical protein FOL47_004543, partial [Perkinsus chesapeaki]
MADSLDSLLKGSGQKAVVSADAAKAALEENKRLEEGYISLDRVAILDGGHRSKVRESKEAESNSAPSSAPAKKGNDEARINTAPGPLPSIQGLLGGPEEERSEPVPNSSSQPSNNKENIINSAANKPLISTSSGLLNKRLAISGTLHTPLNATGRSPLDASPIDRVANPDGVSGTAFGGHPIVGDSHKKSEDKLDERSMQDKLLKVNLGYHELERNARRVQETLENKLFDLQRAKTIDEARFKDEVERFNWKIEQARQEVENDRDRYEERIRRLEEQRALDKQHAEEEIRRAVLDEGRRHELAMERAVFQHRREIEVLKSDHEREIHILKRKQEAEMASLKAASGEREKLSELTAQMAANMAQWEDVASAVKGTTAITEQMKSDQLSARENFVRSLEASMREQQRQIELERSKLSELTREIEEEQKSAIITREAAVEAAARDLNERKLALESQQKAAELDMEDQERKLRAEWEKLRCVQKSVDLSLAATQRRAAEAEVAVARHCDRAAAESEVLERKRLQIAEESAELEKRVKLLREQEAHVRADMDSMVELASRVNSRAEQVAEAYAAAEQVRSEAHRSHADLNGREEELVQGAKELEESKKELEEQRLKLMEAEVAISALKLEAADHGAPFQAPVDIRFGLGASDSYSLTTVTNPPLTAPSPSTNLFSSGSAGFGRGLRVRRSTDDGKWKKLREEAMQVDEYISKNQQGVTAVRMMSSTQIFPSGMFQHTPVLATYPPAHGLRSIVKQQEPPKHEIVSSPGNSSSHHTFVPLQGTPPQTAFSRPGHFETLLSPLPGTGVSGQVQQVAAPSMLLDPLSLASSDQESGSRGVTRPMAIPPLNVAAEPLEVKTWDWAPLDQGPWLHPR